MKKKLTILIPCLNEEKNIKALTKYLCEELKSIEDKVEIDMCLIDGLSRDNSKDIFNEVCNSYKISSRIIENKKKLPAYGINRAIEQINGDIIIRFDCHSIYPKNYIKKMLNNILVENEKNNDIAYIGPICSTISTTSKPYSKAIAYAMNNPFAVGNNSFRTIEKKNDANLIKTHTAPFGIFSKKLFNLVGGYNINIPYGEDDDFCAKIIKSNGVVLLDRTSEVKYIGRESIKELFIQFINYGRAKSLRLIKDDCISPNKTYLIPLLFYSTLIIIGSIKIKYFIAIISIYILCLICSILIINKKSGRYLMPQILAAILTIHIGYSIGSLIGIIEIMKKYNFKYKINKIINS